MRGSIRQPWFILGTTGTSAYHGLSTGTRSGPALPPVIAAVSAGIRQLPGLRSSSEQNTKFGYSGGTSTQESASALQLDHRGPPIAGRASQSSPTSPIGAPGGASGAGIT